MGCDSEDKIVIDLSSLKNAISKNIVINDNQRNHLILEVDFLTLKDALSTLFEMI